MSSDKSGRSQVLRASAVKMSDDQWTSKPCCIKLSRKFLAWIGEILIGDLVGKMYLLGVFYLKPLIVCRRILTVVKHA